jgi:2-C-methyl-D-erythritol 4-phosphate cytidylyltransferase
MRVSAIVLAAGAGRRIGGDLAKAYLSIAGRAMVLRTLDRMFAAKTVTQVILVVAAEDLARCTSLLSGDTALRDRAIFLQTGGATRQESARRGLEKVAADADIVIIHDAARPFVAPDSIDRCAERAAQAGAAVLGVPVRDTIKVVGSDLVVSSTPERGLLWEIQTPQAFQRDLIMAAHAQAERDGIEVTDDAMVVERLGKPVCVIEGNRNNFKITLPEDIWLAEAMVREGLV